MARGQISNTLTVALFIAMYQNAQSISLKRDLFHFGYMLWEYTGRNPIDFTDYGNFCGYGGGGTPVDPLDSCCQVHDVCYSYVQNNSDCSQSTVSSLLMQHYKYDVVDDKIICSKANDPCSQMSCICDKALSECLREFVHQYDPLNRKSYDESLWNGISKIINII